MAGTKVKVKSLKGSRPSVPTGLIFFLEFRFLLFSDAIFSVSPPVLKVVL